VMVKKGVVNWQKGRKGVEACEIRNRTDNESSGKNEGKKYRNGEDFSRKGRSKGEVAKWNITFRP